MYVNDNFSPNTYRDRLLERGMCPPLVRQGSLSAGFLAAIGDLATFPLPFAKAFELTLPDTNWGKLGISAATSPLHPGW
jgi:hypothetical protein